VESQPGIRAKVSVSERMLWLGDRQIAFELEEGRRQRLLQGLDEIGETLAFAERIKAYENMRKAEEPWLFRE
jgi:3-isopropylmalate/(R)-2-methylmalate dehydratase small subunit